MDDEASQQSPTVSETPCEGREDTGDHASSGDESYDSESHDISQSILEEIRSLYHSDKVEILTELIKSRIQQARSQQQLDVFRIALEEASATKMKLQLDLVYSNRIIVCLQDAAKDQVNLSTIITEKYNNAVDMMGELDLKRVQLLKDTRSLQAEFAKYQKKIAQIDKELQEQISRAELESNRAIQLQKQIDNLLLDENNLKNQLAKAETEHQTMISSLSAQLSEKEKQMKELNDQLAKEEKRYTREIETNAALQENIDTILAEKVQASTELARLEIKMAETEKEMEVKLQEMEKSCQIQHANEIEEVKSKCLKLSEEITEKNAEIVSLNDNIAKLRAELTDSDNSVNDERNTSRELENRVAGMQAILEDRNEEICVLHAKLSGEKKRFEEYKQKYSKILLRLESNQTEPELKDNTSEQFETELAESVSQTKIMEDKLNENDEEPHLIMDEVASDEEAKDSDVESVSEESEEKSMNSENQRLSCDSVANQSTLQLTSTPFRPIDLSGRSEATPAKIKRTANAQDALTQKSNGSSSNYSTFQHSVLRKRPTQQYRFFGRKSPDGKSAKPLQQTSPTGSQKSYNIVLNESLNFSDASTINIDDEPMENTNYSNMSPSIRLVKPFLRNNQESM